MKEDKVDLKSEAEDKVKKTSPGFDRADHPLIYYEGKTLAS